MSDETYGSIKDENKFGNTPEGWSKRWKVEMTASLDSLKDFHEAGRGLSIVFLTGEGPATPSRVSTSSVPTRRR
jgi:hypothetical protein